MASPQLVLFDDRVARDWMPFALTRPVGELRFGTLTLRERAERVLGLDCTGYLTADHLAGFDEPGAPAVLGAGSVRTDRDTVYLSTRAVPSWTGPDFMGDREPGIIRVEDEAVGWYAPAGSNHPALDFLLEPTDSGPSVPAEVGAEYSFPGQILERPWNLIAGNADQITRDILALFPDAPRPDAGPGVHLLGESPLVIDASASVEPGVVIDLRQGPVWIDAGARIAPFTHLTGPIYIGRGSTIVGGPIAESTIGPVCRIRGEVEASVVLGYSNKSHDGFLGHAYLGSWVNLGAMTTNSDLKNNYGSIRIWTPSGEVDTGERKLGCLLGDHVKTAIGTLLNTGTVVGAGSNLFGIGLPPRYVAPFSWGTGPGAGEYELERFLSTAAVVMARREVNLTAKQRALLEAAWLLGREERT